MSRSGSTFRSQSLGTRVTMTAPIPPPAIAARIAGRIVAQGSRTRRTYAVAERIVPQMPASLLVPKSVAAGAVGKAPNTTGIDTSPPPPAMELTKPAAKEARVTAVKKILFGEGAKKMARKALERKKKFLSKKVMLFLNEN